MPPSLYHITFSSPCYRLILATDMARHHELLNEFKGIMSGKFNWLSDEDRLSVSNT